MVRQTSIAYYAISFTTLLALSIQKHQVSAFINHQQTFALSSTRSEKVSFNLFMSSTLAANSTVTIFDDKIESDVERSVIKHKIPPPMKNGPITVVHTIDDFLNSIENTQKDELVVVKFHAKFCKVCARVMLKYKKLALTLTEDGANTPVSISFVSIESTANMGIIKTLGVRKFPFLQIYRNSECIASFSTGPAHNFHRAVRGTIDEKLSLPENEWEEFRTEFKSPIQSGLEKLEMLRLQAVLKSEGEEKVENNSEFSP